MFEIFSQNSLLELNEYHKKYNSFLPTSFAFLAYFKILSKLNWFRKIKQKLQGKTFIDVQEFKVEYLEFFIMWATNPNLCRKEVFSDEQKLRISYILLNRLQKSWRFPLKALSTKMRYAFYNIPFQIKLFVASEWIFDRTTNMHKRAYAAKSNLLISYCTNMSLDNFISKEYNCYYIFYVDRKIKSV